MDQERRLFQDAHSGAIIVRPTKQDKEMEKLRHDNKKLSSKIDKIVELLPQLKDMLGE